MINNHTKTLVFTILDILKFKKNDYCENINSVNRMYLRITHANRYIEKRNGNKYLAFNSTDTNKELLKKYNDVFNRMKNEIKTINGGKENE